MSTADAVAAEAPAWTGAAPAVLMIRAPYYRDIVDGMSAAAEAVLREAAAR